MSEPPTGAALKQLPVSTTIDGRTFSGMYSSWNGWVTVTTSQGSKRAEIGGISASGLARMLLRQLVQDGKA